MIDVLSMLWLYGEQIGARGVMIVLGGAALFLLGVAAWGFLNRAHDPGAPLASSYKEDE